MKVWKRYLCIGALLLLPVPVCAADPSPGVRPETTALYQKARDQVAGLAGTPTATRAADVVAQAAARVEAAQSGLKEGNDRTTREASELALVLVKLAQATADERGAAEKVAAARRELDALELKLASILAGKGERP